jgi:hypothetical protein
MIDPVDVLRSHVRKQADMFQSTTNVDELIAHITLEHPRDTAGTPARHRRRRWGSAALGFALFAGLATGTVVTATVLDRAHVARPDAGVFCHVSSTGDIGSGVVTGGASDPITACRALWNNGTLPLIDEISEPTDPALVACTGLTGVVQVFPGESDELCTRLGLSAADLDALAVDPLIDLQEGLSRINAECLLPDQARERALALLDDLRFEGWRVVMRPANGDGCAGVLIMDGVDDTVEVMVLPSRG